MSKLLLVGIDGFDLDVCRKYINDLPFFKRIEEKKLSSYLISTLPPDSVPAWTTIHTGLKVEEHGIIHSFNYLTNDKFEYPSNFLKGKTFWDKISSSEKSVVVINPFLAYPAWKLNGLMISGPVFIDGPVSSYPKEISININPMLFGGKVEIPRTSEMSTFIQKSFDTIKELSLFGIKTLAKEKPRLFFITFLELDRLQHFLWRFCDDNDPDYPGETEVISSIKNAYILFDNILNDYYEYAKRMDYQLIIFSDHGHCRRCHKLFNVNELLRLNGYLLLKQNYKLKTSIVEKTKGHILNSLNILNLHDHIYNMGKLLPKKIKTELKKPDSVINKENSKAFLMDFAGNNPFGGIYTKDNGLNKELTELLLGALDNETGERVVKWAKNKEDLYQYSVNENLPSIIFELYSNYGVSWDLYQGVVSYNKTHKKISGGHRRKGAFIIGDNYPWWDCNEKAIEDISKLIIHLEGL